MSDETTRILVYCGDDQPSLLLLRSGLEDEAYRCVTVPTYEVLKAEIKRGLRPSVLVIDTACPHLDLVAQPEIIRTWHKEKKLAIIALVSPEGAIDEDVLSSCFAQGVDEVVGKPLRLSALQTSIRVWCARLNPNA